MGKKDSDKTPFYKPEGMLPIIEEEIYSALSSQIRREMIVFINDNEKVGFLELRKKFQLQIGSLYHQLNSMREIITQDENKKYYLSNTGKLAYKILTGNIDQIATANIVLKSDIEEKKSSFRRKTVYFLNSFFLPKRIFQFLVFEPIRTFFEGLIIIGLMLYFSIDSQTVLIGFYPLKEIEWYYSLLSVLGLWVFFTLTIELLTVLFYKKKFRPLKIFILVPFASIPMLIILFLLWLDTKVDAIILLLDGQIIAIFSQIWLLSFMTTAVSQAKELTINRSSLIILATFYLTYIIAFITFGLR